MRKKEEGVALSVRAEGGIRRERPLLRTSFSLLFYLLFLGVAVIEWKLTPTTPVPVTVAASAARAAHIHKKKKNKPLPLKFPIEELMDSISMSVHNKNAVHDDANQRLQARRRMSPAIQTTETAASYTKGTMSSPSSTPSSSVSTSQKGKTAVQQVRFPFNHFRIHPSHVSPPHSCHHRSRRRRRGFRGGGVGVYINGRSPQTQTHHHHHHDHHRHRRHNKENSSLLSFSSSSSSLAAGEVVLVAASTTTATRRPPAPSTSTSSSSSATTRASASASTSFTSPCAKLARAFEKVLWTPSPTSHHSHPVQQKQTKKASSKSTSPVLSPKKQPPQKQNKKNTKSMSTTHMPSSSSSSLKSLAKMNIDAQQLIQAATLYAKDMRRMGLIQSARDMETNLVKAQALLKAAPEHVHRDLEALLAYEQSTHQFHRPGGLIHDPSGAVGFLWMRRSLAYQYRMFHLLLHPEESSSSSKTKTLSHPAQAALEAYQSELQPYHGWALQKISHFAVANRSPPNVRALLAQVGGFDVHVNHHNPASHHRNHNHHHHLDIMEDDVEEEHRLAVTRRDLQRLLDAWKPLLERWKAIYQTLDMEDPRKY